MTDASKTGAGEAIAHTHIGGQALLEGVMMRGKLNWAVAVRTPEGPIHVEAHDLPPSSHAAWRKWPIARGMWALVDTLSLSFKAFAIAARYAVPEFEDEGGGAAAAAGADRDAVSATETAAAAASATAAATDASSEPATDAAPEPGGLSGGEIAWAMVLGIVLAVGIFIVLPAIATNLMVGSSLARPFVWNVVDGALRLVVFFGYIALVGLVPDIRRVFAYHGAEHKTIHAFEHGLPLETETVQHYGTLHVRCGTSFLLMVMIVAILVFSLVPGRAILEQLGVDSAIAVILFNISIRILLLPLVAGIAYEVTVKWAGTRPDNPLVRVLLWPGMQMQRLTTREPDDGMVEVAVAALEAVAERESLSAPQTAHAVEPTATAAHPA